MGTGLEMAPLKKLWLADKTVKAGINRKEVASYWFQSPASPIWRKHPGSPSELTGICVKSLPVVSESVQPYGL